MRSFMLCLAMIVLAGCAPDIQLRNPQTGATAVCSGGYYQHGLIGMANETAKQLQMRCLDDFERQGYERVGN
jgi:hypothetical protein